MDRCCLFERKGKKRQRKSLSDLLDNIWRDSFLFSSIFAIGNGAIERIELSEDNNIPVHLLTIFYAFKAVKFCMFLSLNWYRTLLFDVILFEGHTVWPFLACQNDPFDRDEWRRIRSGSADQQLQRRGERERDIPTRI